MREEIVHNQIHNSFIESGIIRCYTYVGIVATSGNILADSERN